jgi:hypothetical protein
MERMASKRQRIRSISAITVICCFMVATAICWYLDFAFPGKLATETRVQVVFDAGVASGFLTL